MTRRTALVTGAAGGVGHATVEAFVREGWRVLATDLKKPATEFGSEVHFEQVNISEETQVEGLPARFKAQLADGLDALVNNAAVQITKPLIETSAAEWDGVHAVNLRAAFLLSKAFHSVLKQAKGAIVNISSVHAMATSAEIGAYASTKGGLLALTRAMAIEFATDGIRANVVLPGATDTPMLEAGLGRGHVQGRENLRGGGMDTRKAELAKKILLQRLAAPDEIARVIYFLADSAQSSYITGQSIVADGGALARLSTE